MTVVHLENKWVDIEVLAEYLGMSRRWLEYRVKDGMPSRRQGASRRFQISQCEDWLIKEGHIEEESGGNS